MRTIYNLFSGQSVERLAALSDGVFAIAMTLLVLDLHVPAIDAIHSEHDLWKALFALAPRLLAYLMTFMTLGIFWVGQQTQLSNLSRADRDLSWIHIGFLLAVSIMPFSTALLASFITYRATIVVYWLNLLLLGIFLFASWRYAIHAGLTSEAVTADMDRAVTRRIAIFQTLYAVGALLCIVNTTVSIAFIVAVQIVSVLAPRMGPLFRI